MLLANHKKLHGVFETVDSRTSERSILDWRIEALSAVNSENGYQSL